MLPKQLVTYMLQDLSQCDSDRVELVILRSQSDLKDSLAVQQSRAIEHLQIKNQSMREAYDMCVEDRTALEVAFKDSDRRIKRARTWSAVGWILSTVLIGALVVQ